MWIILTLFIFPARGQEGHHHHHHHEEMKPLSSQLPEDSVFQLEGHWSDENGKRHSLSDLKGRPRLAAMLFTHCETACPLLVEDLKSIESELPSSLRKKVQVTLFSLDSERDTPEALARFSQKRKLPKDWMLLTSPPEAVAELAAALGVRYKKLENGDFLHSNLIFFLNEKGVIKARKEGLKSPRKKFLKEVSGS